MPEVNENYIETEEQADSLLESVENSDSSPIQDAQPPAPVDEFELTVGGKQIKAKRDQLMQWAQQGYSAPGKISQLTKEIEAHKKWRSEFEPKYSEYQKKYDPVDEYVKQNPQFWDHVLKSYEQRNQVLGDQNNPLAPIVTDLQRQVQELIQHKNQFEETQAKTRATQEDQEYNQGLSQFKKDYPDIDFDTPDEEGKSLEYKVLEHAQNEGIKNFKTAFRDFYHDELLKREASKAKENLTREKQKNTKLGILGVTPMPTKGRSTKSIRESSYDDLANEALQEFGIR